MGRSELPDSVDTMLAGRVVVATSRVAAESAHERHMATVRAISEHGQDLSVIHHAEARPIIVRGSENPLLDARNFEEEPTRHLRVITPIGRQICVGYGFIRGADADIDSRGCGIQASGEQRTVLTPDMGQEIASSAISGGVEVSPGGSLILLAVNNCDSTSLPDCVAYRISVPDTTQGSYFLSSVVFD